MNDADRGVNRLFTKSTAVNKDMEARQSDRIWIFQESCVSIPHLFTDILNFLCISKMDKCDIQLIVGAAKRGLSQFTVL